MNSSFSRRRETCAFTVALSALPRGGVPAATWTAYRAESQFISADGRTVRFNAALTAGDPGSNAALHQVPAIRSAVAAVARAAGASAYGVAGVAPAGYDVGQASDADLLHIVPVAIIVMDAFLVRTLLVPATVALLGRWNWWPSTHGKSGQAALAPEPAPAHCR